MALVEPIHWQVHGRTRYRVAGLQHDPGKKTYLEQYLSVRTGILNVSASAATGNVLTYADLPTGYVRLR